MKVTLINTSDNTGGAAIASRRLTSALTLSGVHSTLLVRDKQTKEHFVKPVSSFPFSDFFNKAQFFAERLSFLRYEKSKNERFWFSMGNIGKKIHHHSLVRQADLLHLHWINSGFISLNGLSKLVSMKKPIVWTMHDSWIFTGGCHLTRDCRNFEYQCRNCPLLKNPAANDISSLLWKKKKQIIENSKTTFITCSKWLRSNAEKSSIMEGKEIHVIPNAISRDYTKILDKEQLRKDLDINRNSFCISFGALNYNDINKGFLFFVKALKEIFNHPISKERKITVLLYGNAGEEHISQIPFPVKIFGKLTVESDIARILTVSDVFILPSRIENLPNTIMESFACQTPVIAFDTGGIPEMIDHTENGYLATPFSHESLAKGIQWSLEHSDLTSCGINARKKAENNYLPEAVAIKHINLYNSLLFHHYNR